MRPIAELFERATLKGKRLLQPSDLDCRTPWPQGVRERVQAVAKVLVEAWRQERFELFGDPDGHPGALELIDTKITPEQRQSGRVHLSPWSLQFWQDPWGRSQPFLWYNLHYLAKPVDTQPAETVAAVAPQPLSREEAVRQIFASGREPRKNGYRVRDLVDDVVEMCGVPKVKGRVTQRGFDRKTLRTMFSMLKNKKK